MADDLGRDGARVHIITTTRTDGDFAPSVAPSILAARRRALVDLPWASLHQVHGAEVVRVTAEDPAAWSGLDGDALVSADAGVALAVQSADCLPVMLWSAEGVIGAAHAGWRGLEAGVLEAAAGAMRGLGATEIDARVGPGIHVECYEFGADDLDRLAVRFGDEIRGRTAQGTLGLDMPRMLAAAAGRAGIRSVGVDGTCTACHPARWYSHRARAEPERMATVIWRDPEPGAITGRGQYLGSET
jgi:YfiH family protein